MSQPIQQTRITLTKLKVSDFASQETLCFVATVLLDGKPIAEARNDGHGGITHLYAMDGARKRLAQAEAFAKSLPPQVTDIDDPDRPGQKITFDVTLDYLVDHIAGEMHVEKKLLCAFNRDFTQRVCWIRDGALWNLKRTKLNAIRNRARVFAKLRKQHGAHIVILAELPRDEAFALWKQVVLKDDEP
jgi:hypothetical protein